METSAFRPLFKTGRVYYRATASDSRGFSFLDLRHRITPFSRIIRQKKKEKKKKIGPILTHGNLILKKNHTRTILNRLNDQKHGLHLKKFFHIKLIAFLNHIQQNKNVLSDR